jgi:hypothetical protein
MTFADWEMLPRDTQKLALTRNMGDALMLVARAMFPTNTAKAAESEWEIDRSSGKNVVKGVAGGVLVTRAVQAEQRKRKAGWKLWLALGEYIIGEPLEAYEKREVARILKEAQLARARQAARSERRAAVAEGAATLVALRDWSGSEPVGRGPGRPRTAAHGVGLGAAGDQVPVAAPLEGVSFAPATSEQRAAGSPDEAYLRTQARSEASEINHFSPSSKRGRR